MMTVTIEANTVPELAKKMHLILIDLNGPQETTAATAPSFTEPIQKPKATAKPQTKAAKAPTKKAKVEAPIIEEEILDEEETAVEAAPTRDTVMEALKYINEQRGIEAARELLGAFGCRKLSELKEDSFQEFIDKARAI